MRTQGSGERLSRKCVSRHTVSGSTSAVDSGFRILSLEWTDGQTDRQMGARQTPATHCSFQFTVTWSGAEYVNFLSSHIRQVLTGILDHLSPCTPPTHRRQQSIQVPSLCLVNPLSEHLLSGVVHYQLLAKILNGTF